MPGRSQLTKCVEFKLHWVSLTCSAKLLIIEKNYGGRHAGKMGPENIDENIDEKFGCLKSLLERELILNF